MTAPEAAMGGRQGRTGRFRRRRQVSNVDPPLVQEFQDERLDGLHGKAAIGPFAPSAFRALS